MPQRTKIDHVDYEIMHGKTNIDTVEKVIFYGKTKVDETDYKIVLGKPLYKYAIGDTVFTYVDGVLTEFIVVHHGNPDNDMYVGCDNGTWLLQKDIHCSIEYGDPKKGYHNSNVHNYLNNTYVSKLDSKVQSIIMDVKIPYCVPDYNRIAKDDTKLYYGNDGLSVKAFTLSAHELGFIYNTNDTMFPKDGAKLDYFEDSSLIEGEVDGAENRIAEFNGVPTDWQTRTPWYVTGSGVTYDTEQMVVVDDDGTVSGRGSNNISNLHTRPCIILPQNTRTDGQRVIRIKGV